MKLLFITFAPLSSNTGHLARLAGELSVLEQENKVYILCLGKESDSQETRDKFNKTVFYHYPATFNGWYVKNIPGILKQINKIIKEVGPDIAIMQMEVWDLMRELGEFLRGKVVFATVIHAMPFLVSPVNPSRKFEQDVIDYANSGVEEFRKKYILDHYKEADVVFENVKVIANNKTVAFYLKNYFKDLKFVTLSDSIVAKRNFIETNNKLNKYDFVYMARIEKGKGLEYLNQILKRISLLISRKVTIAILGRTDDKYTEKVLEKLLLSSVNSKYFKVDYLGWANDEVKKNILPKSAVFLYPSHYDNYPTVVNEALSFGLPCVTWRVPFSKLSYSTTNAVKQVELHNFDKFALAAVYFLNNKEAFSEEAIRFVSSFKTLNETAKLDSQLFRKLATN